MSAQGHKQTLSEPVSDVRFGAVSRHWKPSSINRGVHVCLRAESGRRGVIWLMSAISHNRTLARQNELEHLSLTTLWEKLIKIAVKVA